MISRISGSYNSTMSLNQSHNSSYNGSVDDEYDEVDVYSVRFGPYTALSAAGLLFNVLSLLAMLHIGGRRRVHHLLLINLSVCDMCGSVLLWFCYNSPYLIPWFPLISLERCLFILVVLVGPVIFSISCSALSLLMLAVNQYIAICNPLMSQTHVTGSRACLFIIASWIVSAVASMVPAVILTILTLHSGSPCAEINGALGTRSIEVCTYVLAGLILIIVVLYGRIYKEVLECRRRMSELTMGVRRPTMPRPSNLSGELKGLAGATNRAQDPSESNYKAFITTILLTGALVIFWLPYMIFHFLSAHISVANASDSLINIKFYVIDILPMFTFITDPLIYGVRMREIRRAYHKLMAKVLPCCVRKPKNKIDRGSTMRLTSIETSLT